MPDWPSRARRKEPRLVSTGRLGARPRQLRLKPDLSLQEVASKFTISVSMLSHLERGVVGPSLSTSPVLAS